VKEVNGERENGGAIPTVYSATISSCGASQPGRWKFASALSVPRDDTLAIAPATQSCTLDIPMAVSTELDRFL
jgi:hypothetical protein